MTDSTAEQPHGEQPADTPPGEAARDESSEIGDRESTEEMVLRVVNQSVTAQLRRLDQDLAARFREITQATPESSQQEQPEGSQPAQGKAGEVEALRQRLQAIEAERSSERAQSAQQTRDLSLRQAVESTGTHRVEHLFRFLKGDSALNVGQDGAYYATDQHGGHLSLDEWARQTFQSDATWRPASGRSGGGGTPQGGGASAAMSDAMTKTQWKAKLAELVTAGDQSAVDTFQRKVVTGEIPVRGFGGLSE